MQPTTSERTRIERLVVNEYMSPQAAEVAGSSLFRVGDAWHSSSWRTAARASASSG